jgi:hypothetical protein
MITDVSFTGLKKISKRRAAGKLSTLAGLENLEMVYPMTG